MPKLHSFFDASTKAKQPSDRTTFRQGQQAAMRPSCPRALPRAGRHGQGSGAPQTLPSTPDGIPPLISAPPTVIPPAPGPRAQGHSAARTRKPRPRATPARAAQQRTRGRAEPKGPGQTEGRGLAAAHSAAPPGGRRAPPQPCPRRPRRQDGRPARRHGPGGDMASGARRGVRRLRRPAQRSARPSGFLYRRDPPGREQRAPGASGRENVPEVSLAAGGAPGRAEAEIRTKTNNSYLQKSFWCYSSQYSLLWPTLPIRR